MGRSPLPLTESPEGVKEHRGQENPEEGHAEHAAEKDELCKPSIAHPARFSGIHGWSDVQFF